MAKTTRSTPDTDSRFCSSLDTPSGVIGKKTGNPLDEEAAFLALKGNKGCRNGKGFVLRGEGPEGGGWFPKACGKWDCPAPSCGGLRRAAAAEIFAKGVRNAHQQGEKVRFITLTAPGRGMSLNAVYEGLKRIMSTLKPTGEVREYAGVVEFQERGAPHLHLLATGEYIHYTRLSKLARGRPGSKGRFGEVAWIRSISATSSEDAVKLAGYFTKDLWEFGRDMAGYIPAADSPEMHQMSKSRKRLWPLRKSHNWYEGGVEAAREAVLKRWYPDGSSSTEGMTKWSLHQIDRKTGQIRFITAIPKAPAPESRPLPLESSD
jgi:hypothetical protein